MANTKISFAPKTNDDIVLLDKLHFASIILNILDNSIKYNHKTVRDISVTTFAKNSHTLS